MSGFGSNEMCVVSVFIVTLYLKWCWLDLHSEKVWPVMLLLMVGKLCWVSYRLC